MPASPPWRKAGKRGGGRGETTRGVQWKDITSPGACLWRVSFLCGPGSSRENPHHPGSLSLCINFTEPQHQPLPFSPRIIGVSFSCWVGGAARGIWGRTAVCSELSLHFLWGLDTSKPYAFPVSRPCSVWALEAQDGPRFTPPHLELTSPATQVYGDWDDGVICVHIQEEKTTFKIKTSTPMTQQNWNPPDCCLPFSLTTWLLKTRACAEKPQVPLSGDFLCHPVLLLVYWLAFLFIRKKKSICCWGLGFVFLRFWGFFFVCFGRWGLVVVFSRNSQFFWYVF